MLKIGENRDVEGKLVSQRRDVNQKCEGGNHFFKIIVGSLLISSVDLDVVFMLALHWVLQQTTMEFSMFSLFGFYKVEARTCL